jgi:phosphoglycolate phosphatase-like HAD superfamily hydrolase
MAFAFGIFGETMLTGPENLDGPAIEEVHATLDLLSHYHIPVAIISSASRESIKGLEELGIIDRFVVISLEVGDKAGVIRETVKRHPGLEDLRPRDTFFVDTTPDGIAHAHSAGVVPFAFSTERKLPPALKMAGAEWYLQSWRDLQNVIRANNN